MHIVSSTNLETSYRGKEYQRPDLFTRNPPLGNVGGGGEGSKSSP